VSVLPLGPDGDTILHPRLVPTMSQA